MSLVLIAGPQIEPVTLDAAKAHLRVDGAADDIYIAALIETSRLQIEAALGLALIEQTWRMTFDAWPEDVLELPLHPVTALLSVEIAGDDGEFLALPPSSFRLDGAARPPIVTVIGETLPHPSREHGGIRLELMAGFGTAAADVPAPIRHALLLLVAHWYECREPNEQKPDATRIPESVSALLAPYRVVRL